MSYNIGFIQGRLSPIVDNKIQAFPWDHWEDEFSIANQLGLKLMEWTLDYEKLYKNPLLTNEGQKTIQGLTKKYNIKIPSLTGDCFMQKPFFKSQVNERSKLINDLESVIYACAEIGIKLVVFPLVDGGSIEDKNQEDILINELTSFDQLLLKHSIKIVFESDYDQERLKAFISKFSPDTFGINYDIGNSAALGFNFKEEINSYGLSIENVHVKDRLLNGTTVPLGQGNANLPGTIKHLKDIGYDKNFILQTARSKNNHATVLFEYYNQLKRWLD